MIYCIIQARMGATRLPGKVLKQFCGKSVLMHIVDRLKYADVDKIIVATSRNPENNGIVKECMDNDVYYFKGSENNVLGRYYNCAEYEGMKQDDGIIRITADCPLVDPEIINKLIKLWQKNKDKYVSNVEPPTFPDGYDCEMFSFGLLQQAWQKATPDEQEHVTTWLRKNAKKVTLKNDMDLSKLRLTLDTPEDFEVIERIYNKLYKKDRVFLFDDVLRYLGV